MIHHKINATHANFLASMDRKLIFKFVLCKESCFVNEIQSKQQFLKTIVTQIRHKKIASRCNMLWWFASNV
jgi:hypothetical protein